MVWRFLCQKLKADESFMKNFFNERDGDVFKTRIFRAVVVLDPFPLHLCKTILSFSFAMTATKISNNFFHWKGGEHEVLSSSSCCLAALAYELPGENQEKKSFARLTLTT